MYAAAYGCGPLHARIHMRLRSHTRVYTRTLTHRPTHGSTCGRYPHKRACSGVPRTAHRPVPWNPHERQAARAQQVVESPQLVLGCVSVGHLHVPRLAERGEPRVVARCQRDIDLHRHSVRHGRARTRVSPRNASRHNTHGRVGMSAPRPRIRRRLATPSPALCVGVGARSYGDECARVGCVCVRVMSEPTHTTPRHWEHPMVTLAHEALHRSRPNTRYRE